MAKHRILVVEDNKDLARLIQFNLQQAEPEAYDTIVCHKSPEALELLLKSSKNEHFDLVILDLMMPEMDGFTFLKKLRNNEKTKYLPVFILTARGAEEDRIQGFKIGADDYITKPFSVPELKLRIKRFFERQTQVKTPEDNIKPIEFGCLILDEARFRTTVNGKDIDVSATEMKLLAEMIHNKGKALKRRRILELAWGEMPNVTDRTIDTHVKRLRKKLGPAANYLQTVRGIGYRWAEKPENND